MVRVRLADLKPATKQIARPVREGAMGPWEESSEMPAASAPEASHTGGKRVGSREGSGDGRSLTQRSSQTSSMRTPL